MRSNAFLLAIGLFVADSAHARLCRPKTSTLDAATTTSIASTTQPTTTAGQASADVSSETRIETGTTTTLAPATTTATTSDAQITTAADITTTTSEAESTTTAPVPTPTFTIVGGGGSVNGAPLKSSNQQGSFLIFNPQFPGPSVRTFILDPKTGLLQDRDTGYLVCVSYGRFTSPSDPVSVTFCLNGNTGPNSQFDNLTCQVVSGKLACTAPKASCTYDQDDNTICTTVLGNDVNNQFYYGSGSGPGDYLYMSSGSPSGYTSVSLIAQGA